MPIEAWSLSRAKLVFAKFSKNINNIVLVISVLPTAATNWLQISLKHVSLVTFARDATGFVIAIPAFLLFFRVVAFSERSDERYFRYFLHMLPEASRCVTRIGVINYLSYLHHQSAYGHQTWYGRDISWRAPDHKLLKRFDHVVL